MTCAAHINEVARLVAQWRGKSASPPPPYPLVRWRGAPPHHPALPNGRRGGARRRVEVELFGVCPHAPWQRLDRKGVAFGGSVQAVTQEAVTYVGGLRRYRAQVNNDNGAVPVWDLAG